uniref:Uncharacterized protein n=1 Tax=Ditylenchus dipsaci TaxID=166011 RepID=A0A915EG15_9BILA
MEGLDKKEAAMRLVEQKRKPKIGEGDRVNISLDQMPWVPNVVDHRRYVAIISNFLSTVPNFRFEMNKLEIEAMDDRLKEEREKFNKAAFEAVRHWKKSPFRYQAMGSVDFFTSREYAKYKMVLELLIFAGSFATWKTASNSYPRCQAKMRIQYESSVIEQHFALEPAVKISIDRDEKAMEYAMERGIEYLMDGSTVRHLMSNKWPNRNQTFANRVSVVQRVKQGSIQRVVIVSKPVLASQLEILYLTRQFIKWAAKCELRSKFVPNSSKLRTSKATLREMLHMKYGTSDEPAKKINEMEVSDDEGCSLQIAENTEFSSHPMVVAPSVPKFDKLQPKVEVNDILGGNAGGHPQSFVNIAEEKVDSTSSSRTKRYSVMKFDNEGKHEVLVRTSNHGVDQNGVAVSVTVKPEYIPEIGSDKLHLEEELWNLVTGIVKDSVEQCNLHMYPRIGHCLQIKRISGNQRTCNLSPELKHLLESRTARMCVLLDALDALEAGEYLMYPEGNSMTILKEAGSEVSPSEIPSDEIEFDNSSKVFNYTSLARRSLFMAPRFSNDFSKNWNGLNPHFPLVWHIINGRIPGQCFRSEGTTSIGARGAVQKK